MALAADRVDEDSQICREWRERRRRNRIGSSNGQEEPKSNSYRVARKFWSPPLPLSFLSMHIFYILWFVS